MTHIPKRIWRRSWNAQTSKTQIRFMYWGSMRKDYRMNGKSFEVMDYLARQKKMQQSEYLRFDSKAEFRKIFDITEPTYRKIMADLTDRGYIRYIENTDHFVEVMVLA